MITTSIIVPAHNEEATIIPLLQSVQESIKKISNVSFEVIVINDCSVDRTGSLLENNQPLYDHLISLAHRRGKGGAVLQGLEKATGDFILFQDADLEYNPQDYEKLLRPITEFNADLVIGSRFLAPEWTRVQYFWHKMGNVSITLFFNVLNNTAFSDIYSCYLIYRRVLVSVDQIRTTGWEQHGEIIALAVRSGRALYEVPITYRGRTYEEGKKIRPYHVFKILSTLLTTRFRRN